MTIDRFLFFLILIVCVINCTQTLKSDLDSVQDVSIEHTDHFKKSSIEVNGSNQTSEGFQAFTFNEK